MLPGKFLLKSMAINIYLTSFRVDEFQKITKLKKLNVKMWTRDSKQQQTILEYIRCVLVACTICAQGM